MGEPTVATGKHGYVFRCGSPIFKLSFKNRFSSLPTANRIKKSGKIDKAITQIGRKIIVDAELALELAGKKTGGRK